MSELPILGQYFLTHWPLLSPLHGFFALGLAMIAIGADVLGNLNKPSASQASLGDNIWRLVISSGIILLVLGFVNIIAVSSQVLSRLLILTSSIELHLLRPQAPCHRPSDPCQRCCRPLYRYCRPPQANRYHLRTSFPHEERTFHTLLEH